jgi:predicted AAA+ superfamily ATPase
MILKKRLEDIIEHQNEQLFLKRNGTERQIKPNLTTIGQEFIKVITGIRRCGKSTLMLQILSQTDKSIFINFEDPRLTTFGQNDFLRLDEIILENGVQNLFFDEIQVLPEWEKYIRRKHDEGFQIFVTGSNASLLSKELGTKLTGRHLPSELFPFSYTEFLSFLKRKKSAETSQEYFRKGGFPEYLRYDNDEILYQVLYDIIYRDISVRYGIKRHETLKQMAVYLMSNTSKLMSYNQLRKLFSLGSTNTAVDFVSYYQNSYLMFTVPKFDYSIKKQIVNQRKVYAVDTGLASVNSLSFSKDNGRMLENAVFLTLRRKYKQIYYFRNIHECDFIVIHRNAVVYAIQVCYQLNDDNIDRELNGLAEAAKAAKLAKLLIVTFDQEDRLEVDKREVQLIPFWKWELT